MWYLICSYVGGGFAGLVSLTSSPYSSEILVSSRKEEVPKKNM